MFWNFGDFMTFLTGNRNWYYFSRIGSSMLPALMFHFIIDSCQFQAETGNLDPASLCPSGLFAFIALSAMFHPGADGSWMSGLRNILYLFLWSLFFSWVLASSGAIRRTKLKDQRQGFVIS